MFRNTIRCSPICQSSTISSTGVTVNEKITVLKFHHVIDFLEIGHLLDRHVRSLSRGENQRVVIARALLSAPQLLLLDEPLTSLDAKLKNAILQQLQALHGEFGIPMLFVTHDPMEAMQFAKRYYSFRRVELSGEVIRQNFSAETSHRSARTALA